MYSEYKDFKNKCLDFLDSLDKRKRYTMLITKQTYKKSSTSNDFIGINDLKNIVAKYSDDYHLTVEEIKDIIKKLYVPQDCYYRVIEPQKVDIEVKIPKELLNER